MMLSEEPVHVVRRAASHTSTAAMEDEEAALFVAMRRLGATVD